VDWLHLVMNLIVFIILGYRIEKNIHIENYSYVVMLSILLTPLFSFFRHCKSKNYHSVGISGVTSCFMTFGLFICPSWIFYMIAGSTFAGYFFGKKDWIAQEVHISGYVLGIIFGLLFNIYAL
jgi:membrane associated rhomboid family serine protease